MSNYDTFIDSLRTVVAGLTGFTAKTELPNPYVVEANPEGMLRDGWGLRVGASAVGTAEFNSTVDVHEIGLVLTREAPSTDSNPAPLLAAVKGLKSDAETLCQYLERGDDLSAVENYTYLSTSPVVFGEGERNRWVTITVTFNASIRSNLL